MLHHGSLGRLQNNKCYYVYIDVVDIFVINLCFYQFYSFFFDEVSNFHNIISISQTIIGDEKLSVEVYVKITEFTLGN